VSIAVPVTQPKGGQFVLHAKALHGNPFDGHTLKGAVADVESNTGGEVRRIHVDKGSRGHGYPNRFRVFISGQVRRTTAAIKREMKRRAAVEPVIGHLKVDHRMDRNYLTGRNGDRINPPRRRRFQLPPPPEVAGGALAHHFPRRHRSLANPSASLTPYVGRSFTDDYFCYRDWNRLIKSGPALALWSWPAASAARPVDRRAVSRVIDEHGHGRTAEFRDGPTM